LFASFAIAFAIKVPLFPLHTWLPDAHTQAPTSGSVILAAVLLKMGTYGFIRFAIPMFPYGASILAPYLVWLSVIGIVYGALVAYAQRDAKKLVAYSSVSHLGFVMLGVFAMNQEGLQGSIYQMVGHGISTGGLFLVIGILYNRRHTHLLSEFGGLWKKMPLFGAIFMLVMLSSAGLPGLNGFVGEFLVLIGMFKHAIALPSGATIFFTAHPVIITALAATGVIFGALYLLHLFQKLMLGTLSNPDNENITDIRGWDIVAFVPIIVLIVWMGVYPKPFLSRIAPSTVQMTQEFAAKFEASEAHREGLPVRVPELVSTSRPLVTPSVSTSFASIKRRFRLHRNTSPRPLSREDASL